MTMIGICFLWQVIYRCETNKKKHVILFLLIYKDSCHKLVANGMFEDKWFKLPQERHNVDLFYKKV